MHLWSCWRSLGPFSKTFSQLGGEQVPPISSLGLAKSQVYEFGPDLSELLLLKQILSLYNSRRCIALSTVGGGVGPFLGRGRSFLRSGMHHAFQGFL